MKGQAGGQPFPKWGQETGSCHQVSLESLHSPLPGPPRHWRSKASKKSCGKEACLISLIPWDLTTVPSLLSYNPIYHPEVAVDTLMKVRQKL